MAKIRVPRTLPEALKGCDHAVLLAPASALADGLLGRLFKGKTGQLAAQLADGLEPGPVGKVATTLTGPLSQSNVDNDFDSSTNGLLRSIFAQQDEQQDALQDKDS
jgi:hypothetical protein